MPAFAGELPFGAGTGSTRHQRRGRRRTRPHHQQA